MLSDQNATPSGSLLGAMSPEQLRSINFPHPSGLLLHIEKQEESRLARLGAETIYPLIHLNVGKIGGPFTIADLGEHSLPTHQLGEYLESELIRNILVEKYVYGQNTGVLGVKVYSWAIGNAPRNVYFSIALGSKNLVETLTDDMFK